MLFNTQQFLCAACSLFAFTAIGCTDGFPFSFPLPAHGQEVNQGAVSPDEVVPAEERPDREFDVLAKEPDGSTTVQFSQVVFEPVMQTRKVKDFNGDIVEESSTNWVPKTHLKTILVPSGEDIVQFLNEHHPQLLPRPNAEEDVIYEVVERESDGTIVVAVNLFDFRHEILTRTIVRNGREIEQCYARYEPTLHAVARIRVPAGREILEAVGDFHFAMNPPPAPIIEDAPIAEPVNDGIPAAPAPAFDDIPPAPVVEPDA